MRVPIVIAATLMVSACLFYLTPLRFLNPVDPPMYDVDPAIAYANMLADPEHFLFIDVRQSSAYKVEHAVGAINIPLQNLYNDRFALPKTGKTIVLICGDGRAAGVAYGYLEHYGFLNLQRIEGGLKAWVNAGLPTLKGGG